MTGLNPYLTFPGNCEEAFNYYQKVFGGEFIYVGRFGEMPPQEGAPELSAEEKQKIMHISLPLYGGALMGSDAGGDWGKHAVIGNNISLSINVPSAAEADRIHAALSDGGMVTMPMAKTFWGDYFGMCTDSFGINWMISFNENPQG
ncbi:MAG: VOC family protein [Chitinophagales bacterium]